jgi:hypothetical protein
MSTPLTPATTEAAIAQAVAAAVVDCPAVASLHAGGIAHRAVTYLPGRRIEGVRVDDHRVDDHRVAVSVVGVQGIPVAVLADQVRTAVAPLAPGRAVDVHVADLEPLEQQPPALTAGPSA